MKVFKGTLTFVLGMIVGIILFVVTIGGAVFAISKSVTVGELQDKVGISVIDKNSEIIDDNLWNVVTNLIGDIQNIDKLTVQTLIDKYGLPIPKEISGIDISMLFKYPIMQIPNHMTEVVNSVTLADIGKLAGVDFASYKLPILTDNLNSNVQTALDAVLSSINGDTMTIRAIEDNFGFALGDNQILNTIKDAPLSAFGGLINAVNFGTLMDLDSDLFVKAGANDVYVKNSDEVKYEEVLPADFAKIKTGASTYISGTDATNKLLFSELRFVKKEVTAADGTKSTKYVVNNTSNAVGFTPTDKTPKFYRLVEFAKYDTTANYPVGTEYFVPAFDNAVEAVVGATTPTFEIKRNGYVSLNKIFTSEQMTTTVSSTVTAPTVDLNTFYYANHAKPPVGILAEPFGLDGTLTADSKLDETKTGFFRAKLGESSVLLQTLGGLTISTIGNAQNELLDMKLGDILVIDETSSQILQNFKDKSIRDMTSEFDKLTMRDIMEIKVGAYVPDDNGIYTFVANGEYYTLYNPSDSSQSTSDRFSYLPGYVKATEKQITAGTGLFYYSELDKIMKAYTKADGDKGVLYVAGEPTSKVLQRLSGIKLGDFATAFDSLILGDVLDIDVDTFSKFAVFDKADTAKYNSATTYYYFNDQTASYLEADIASLTAADNGKIIYTLNKKGGANAVLKKLALIKVTELGNKMGGVIDNLSIGEVISIQMSAYVKDDNGKYIFVKNGGYYTYFDAANTAQIGQQRFSKIEGYAVASSAEIEDAKVNLFYFDDAVTRTMIDYTRGSGDKGTLYVKGNGTSQLLQRFNKMTLGGFGTAFDDILLGDVLAIDADIYAPVTAAYIQANPTVTYYHYNAGVYLTADAEYRGTHPTEQFYILETVGAGNKILKKLAFLKITELGTRMDEIIKDMRITDIIDVVEFSQVETDTSTVINEKTDRWFVPYDPVYTVVSDNGTSKTTERFSFVYNANGKYYRSAVLFEEATPQQKVVAKTINFKYVSLGNKNPISYAELVQADKNASYLYYKDTTGNYIYNPAVTGVLMSKNMDKDNTNDTWNRLYYRSTTGATVDVISAEVYKTPNLFVNLVSTANIKGEYVAYDPTILAHLDADIYFKYVDGYYLASADCIAQGQTTYAFNHDTGAYAPSATGELYIKMTADAKGKYYYKNVDKEFSSAPSTTYAKELAESVYYKSATGKFVYIGGKYVPYDSANKSHEGLNRYTEKLGVLSHIGGVALINSNTGAYDSWLSTDKVTVTLEKSANILRAFAKNDISMAKLDTAISKFTIGEIMAIEPGSIFEDFKNSTIDNLGKDLSAKLSTMSIGDMLEWGNIATMDENVKALISEVTLARFFGSITFDGTNFTIDILKMYEVA